MASSSRRTASIRSGASGSALFASVSTRSGRVKSTEIPVAPATRSASIATATTSAAAAMLSLPIDLGAELEPLARGIDPVALDRHDLSAVAQPQRPGRGREPGRGHPPDLRGHVRAQRERAQRGGVDEAEHPPRLHPVHAAGERFLELDRGRLHPVVAVRVEHIEHRARHPRRHHRRGRQAVAEPFGQQIAVGIVHPGALSGDPRRSTSARCTRVGEPRCGQESMRASGGSSPRPETDPRARLRPGPSERKNSCAKSIPQRNKLASSCGAAKLPSSCAAARKPLKSAEIRPIPAQRAPGCARCIQK